MISLISAPIILFSLFIIWPTDPFLKPVKTLLRKELSTGEFTVTQVWNSGDFYTTVARFRPKNAHREEILTLDGDAPKQWWASLQEIEKDKKYLVKLWLWGGSTLVEIVPYEGGVYLTRAQD